MDLGKVTFPAMLAPDPSDVATAVAHHRTDDVLAEPALVRGGLDERTAAVLRS